jgi:hypothetical protein
MIENMIVKAHTFSSATLQTALISRTHRFFMGKKMITYYDSKYYTTSVSLKLYQLTFQLRRLGIFRSNSGRPTVAAPCWKIFIKGVWHSIPFCLVRAVWPVRCTEA